jgi:predicted transcriptional regulator
MAAISLKLPDELLDASRECAEALRVPRAEYIRRAIERMNRETRAHLRARRLADASRKVRRESLKINAEFAAIERDPDA